MSESMDFVAKRAQIDARLAELTQAFNEAQSIMARAQQESAYLQGQLALLTELETPRDTNGTPDETHPDS